MNINVSKGELLILSEGEYDDYHIVETVRALVDFRMRDVCKEFMSQHGEYGDVEDEDGNYVGARGGSFVQWLISKRLVEKIEIQEVRFGEYGKFDKRIYCDHDQLKWTLWDRATMFQKCEVCGKRMDHTARRATFEEYCEVLKYGTDSERREWYQRECGKRTE